MLYLINDVQSYGSGPMTYSGTVQNGIIVLNGGVVLPEGSDVQIVLQTEQSAPAAPSSEGSIWADLARLGREVESLPCDLPEDFAENHDHYLYGAPKR